MKYDVAIIGGGPGGYVAAIRATQLGMKTVVIEKDNLGGICLNWGCIPTKALLRSSEIHRTLQHAEEYGFTIKGIEFNIKKIVERSRKVSAQLSAGIAHLMKKNKIDVIKGTAKILSAGKISVNNETIEAKHIIIATGARARVLPGFEPDGDLVMTYKEAMTPEKLPKNLLVVGSGAIGVEFASFYRNMGSEVTIVEIADRIMPVEDKEVSNFMKTTFEHQGMKILLGSKLSSIKKHKNKVEAIIESKDGNKNMEFDAIIMAIGIQANTENLGLENTKVKLDRGHIVINEWCETAEKGIYAIGDVVGAPWLAHKASHEGVICIEKIAGVKGVHPMKKHLIPGCTYSMPQVASVGLTEDQAKAKGLKIKVGKFPFIANGKAIAIGHTEGFVKTIFDEKTGELLGAHMVGAEVTEMIQGYVIAMNLETTEEELMQTIFAHPTLSEAMHESVLSAYGKALHI
jgi:dihydrolipoamide dehydrogenase